MFAYLALGTATVAQTPAADGLCPIVPVACVVDIPGADSLNPISAFWDHWFSGSPEDLLSSASNMIFNTPYPDFSADWFRAVYLESGIVWLGYFIATLTTVAMMVRYCRDWRKFLLNLRDYGVSLVLVSVMPTIVGFMFYLSAGMSDLLMSMLQVDDKTDLAKMIDPNYFSVGWMSFFIRLVSIMISLEVLFLVLASVLVVIGAGIFIPLRTLDAFGFSLQTNFWRFVLMGAYVKPLMILVLGVSVQMAAVVSPASAVAPAFMKYGLVLFALIAAGLSPYYVFRKSKEPVRNAVLAANARMLPTQVHGQHTASSWRVMHDNIQRERAQRRQDRMQRAKEIAGAAVMGYATGGASVALASMATSATKNTKSAQRIRRGVDAARTYNQARNQRGGGQP